MSTIEVPVEPGTPVYVLDPCYCSPHLIPTCKMRDMTSTQKRTCMDVFPTKNKKGRAHCWKLYIRPFDPVKHLALWGKRVFATKEEAITAATKN